MPFERPTRDTIRDRIAGDIETAIGATAPLLRNSVLLILARALAGSVHLNYGYIDWVSKQSIPDTADGEYLEHWASDFGIYRKPATFASGVVQMSGTNATAIPQGTVFVGLGGLEYTSTADAVIGMGSALVPISCNSSGAAGSLDEGFVLSLLSPIAGIDGSGPVSGDGLLPGFDAETDESLLARLLSRLQDPPHGGAAVDYIQWALATPTVSVARAWCYPSMMGPGTVGVTFTVTGVDPIPNDDEVAAVAAYIEGLRPVTAQVTVFAPTTHPIAIHIALTPSTVATKAAVTQAIADFLANEGAPGSTIYLSRLNDAISQADGEFDHVLTLPVANVVLGSGEIATLGVITWE